MKAFKTTVLVVLLFLCGVGLFAQDLPNFGLRVGLGSSILPSKAGKNVTWNNVRLQPELKLGIFGVGFDLGLNFSLTDENGAPGFRIREEDWIPSGEVTFQSVLELYLPLIKYIRFGEKGEPLYAEVGSLDNITLGNGFIVSNYSNKQFLPERRIVGLAFDLDTAVFDFPYFGIETFLGNLSAIDVFGGRFYARPIYWADIPVFRELELGFTVALDRTPFLYERKASTNNSGESTSLYRQYFSQESTVVIFGGDIRVPILNDDIFRLALFADIVAQNNNPGGMVGLGAELFDLIIFGSQFQFLGANFIPNYFDTYYDLYRARNWQVYSGNATKSVPAHNRWLAYFGIDVLDGQIIFDANLEGPFEFDTSIDILNPTFKAGFHLDPRLIGLSIDIAFEKRYIKEIADLVKPEDSIIAARIGYNFGGVEIALNYDLKYDPTPGPDQLDGDGNPRYWSTTTTFETSFSLLF